jgi:PhnB protein
MSDRPNLTPYLVVNDAAAAIEFYIAAFDAETLQRHLAPYSERIMHAHLKINGGDIMLCDDFSSEMKMKSETPIALGGSPITIALVVKDAQTAWDKAIAAGAEVTMPLADQFWGDRYGQFKDPFGHRWSISQVIANPTNEEIDRAAAEAFPDTETV